MAAWRYEISLLVLKKYFTSERSERVKYFSTLEEKFCISARPCNILYISFMLLTGTENSVVVKLLKAEYKRRSKLMPLSWFNTIQLPLENVYTRLKIVSRRKTDFQVELDELDLDEIFQALDESEDVMTQLEESPEIPLPLENPHAGKNDEVDMYDIFKDLEKGEDVMTLVEGSPGIGKTTFCLKLAYDWARETVPANPCFPKLEFVLLLKCRDIDKDIMEAIKEQLLPEDIKEETWTKFSELIKDVHNQERILIILDGLNELPEKSQHFVDKLLRRRILPLCYILVTSRQEKGIDVRKNFEFDLLLEIKGFTEDDAYCYIKKHFQNVGPKHSSKGERLAKEVKENTLLNALRNNPLNLLLLCVIYEDYDGKLPTSRTELYEVIVQCLLRRYCAKHSLLVPEDNTLKKRFEEDILALGELAWTCLLNDRQSFGEEELAEREVRNKNLVARKIGLLYKEERLKRILRSQYEYWFLHKTFQEYLAAAFITHKLQRGGSVFEYTTFDDLVEKYQQVFLFVSGMLSEKATVLFAQIGEKLKEKEDWNWNKCSQQALQFFVESFSESRHAEEMAITLCSCIPFPQQVYIDLHVEYSKDNIFQVLKAFGSFRNLPQPVKLTVQKSSEFKRSFVDRDSVTEYIQSCTQIQTLCIFIPVVTSNLANVLRNGLFGNTTLSDFTLQICGSIPCHTAVVIGELLAARKALRKVTFQLDRVWGEKWASAIEPALSADTPLRSLNLQVRGSLSDTAAHGLGELLSNKALTSFSFNTFGDIQEWEAAAISRGIARQTAVRSLDLSVNGNLSLSCVNVLQSSLLENRSLNDLVLTVHGEIPENWQFVVENLRMVKKGSVDCAFHPDPGSSVTCKKMAHFCSAVVEKGLETNQHLTIVLWGELECDGAKALFEVLVRVPLTGLTLKVHGKLSDGVANIIERYFRQQDTLSSLTIDIWGELTPRTRLLLQELSRNNATVEVKVYDVCVVPKEACNAFDVSIGNPSSLTPVFSEIKNTKKEKINLRIINDGETSSDWPYLLTDALAENTSVTALDLTVSNYTMNSEMGKDLGDSLLRSSSLIVLSLTISNYGNMANGWQCTLVNSLAKMASLAALSLAIDDRGEVNDFVEDLMAVKSLSTLSVVINGSSLDYFWNLFLNKSLKECTSLTKLCLTSNNYKNEYDPFGDDALNIKVGRSWREGLAYGLERNTSLKELAMTINNITCTSCAWRGPLIDGLLENESITSLTVTVSDYEYLSCEEWVGSLKRILAHNKSLTTLTLTVNDHSEGKQREGWIYGLKPDYDFPENTSLTDLNLTVNIRSEVSEDWLPSFCDYLMMNCSSLRTVRLQVNNRCATSESRIYDLSKLQLKYRSLSTFELSVTFYGE